MLFRSFFFPLIGAVAPLSEGADWFARLGKKERSEERRVGKVDKPSKGWTAFFVELKFPSGCEAPFKFTTQVRVIPDALPYKFVANAHP